MSTPINSNNKTFKPYTSNDLECHPDSFDLTHPELIKDIHSRLSQNGSNIRNKFAFSHEGADLQAYYHQRNIGITIDQVNAKGSKSYSISMSLDGKDGNIVNKSKKRGKTFSEQVLKTLMSLISQLSLDSINRKLDKQFVPNEGFELTSLNKTKPLS